MMGHPALPNEANCRSLRLRSGQALRLASLAQDDIKNNLLARDDIETICSLRMTSKTICSLRMTSKTICSLRMTSKTICSLGMTSKQPAGGYLAQGSGVNRGQLAEAAYRGWDYGQGFVDIFGGVELGQAEAQAGAGAFGGESHGGEHVGRLGCS